MNVSVVKHSVALISFSQGKCLSFSLACIISKSVAMGVVIQTHLPQRPRSMWYGTCLSSVKSTGECYVMPQLVREMSSFHERESIMMVEK